jgi:nucleotide-binding universal stress UspA family protein
MSRGKKRKSQEEGHSRKFLVVVDGTPECGRALHFAARRAEHSGGRVTLLTVISPADFQHWLGVENIMREEAREEAEEMQVRMIKEVKTYCDLTPDSLVREGDKAEEIVGLIEEDEDMAILVLGASTDSAGPGPLVAMLANAASTSFPIPVTIVPGDLTDEEIDALA